MTSFGVDYSGSRPNPTCLAANGVKFVGRYLEPANDWKTLKKPETDRLLAAGLTIFSMFELEEGRSLKGYDAGVTDARGVRDHMPDIGMPADRPVYFAVDFDATPAQLAGPITGYFQGIAAVMPWWQIGAYGGYYTMKHLFDNDLIAWGFQAAAWSQIDGVLVWDERVSIQQYRFEQSMCGTTGDIDFCRGMTADIGQWPLPETAMSAPRTKVTVPTFLKDKPNGKLDDAWLRSPDEHTGQVWKMFAPVSYAMQAMHVAAAEDGIELRSTGRYRTYERQAQLFLDRYSPIPIPGRPTKTWEGVTFWQRPGVAMAATPGTSNHGLGLADDVAEDDSVPEDLIGESIDAEDIAWLDANQEKYGFGLETPVEQWHRHWVGGDSLNQLVVDTLYNAGITIPDLSEYGFTVPRPTPLPEPPPPKEDDDMATRIARSSTNGYALRRGIPGIGADLLRSNEATRLKARLDAGLPVPYVNATDGSPITSFDSSKPGGIPVLDETDMDLYVGYITYDSAAGGLPKGDEG